MYRSIVFVLSLILSFGSVVPVFAQDASGSDVDSVIAETTSTEVTGNLECVDYYHLGSVQADLQTNLTQTVPGVTLAFSGKITNRNTYPLVEGKLSIKIFKNDEVSLAADDGNLVIDQFVIAEDIALSANGSVDTSFEWTVPRRAEGGEYYAAYFFTTSDRYNLMGLSFTDNVIGNQASFTVTADPSNEVAKLQKSDTTINGQDYKFTGDPLQFERDEVVTISTTIINPTDEEKTYFIALKSLLSSLSQGPNFAQGKIEEGKQLVVQQNQAINDGLSINNESPLLLVLLGTKNIGEGFRAKPTPDVSKLIIGKTMLEKAKEIYKETPTKDMLLPNRWNEPWIDVWLNRLKKS